MWRVRGLAGAFHRARAANGTDRRRRGGRYVEPLECRCLLSVAPARPDLLASSDTGVSDSDNITRFDNASPAAALQFLVGGTTPGAMVTLYVDGRAVGSATAAGPSTLVTADAGQQVADGSHAVTARQTDPGGEASLDSPPLSVVVDAIAPAAPAPPDLEPASDTGPATADNVTNDNTPMFTVPGAPYFRLLRGGVVVTGPYEAGPSYTSAALPDGVHAFAVEAVDPAGNVSAASAAVEVTIDTVRPAVALDAPLAPAAPGSDAYTFAVAYTDAGSVDGASINGQDVQVTGPGGFTAAAALVSVTSENGGARRVATYRFTPPGGAWDYGDNGQYTVRLQASQVRDVAGNFANAAALGTLTVNLLTPTAVPDLLPATDSGVSASDDLTRFDNSSPARALQFLVRNTFVGATVTVFADGTAIGSATATGPETTIATAGSLALPGGYYAITAGQTKAGEAPPPRSLTLGLTIDTAAPPRPAAPDLRASSDSGVSDADDLTNDNTPTFDLALTLAPYFRAFRNGVPASGDYTPGTAFTPAALPDGVHAFTVAAVDAAGNASETSPPLQITVDTVAPAAGALAGELDTSFDGDGRWFIPGPGVWHSAAVQPDGKVILAGGQSGQPLVVRLNADGSYDTTFGVGGRITVGDPNRAYLGIQPDGRIVLAGTFAVYRLSPSGGIDTSFGTGGSTPIDFPIRDLAVGADGKVFVTGFVSTTNSGDQLAAARLTADGKPDLTFGGTGRVVGPGGHAFSVDAMPDGRSLVAGYFGSDTVIVVRYNVDGSLDASFGDAGRVIRRYFVESEAHSVDARPDGTILISGVAYQPPAGERDVAFLARLNADGSPDTTFDGDGVQTLSGTRGFGTALSAGDAFLVSQLRGDIAFAHYDAAGRVDAAVPGGRIVTPSGTASGFSPMEFAATPDDKVVLVGYGVNAGGSLAAYRLHGYTYGVPDLQAASDTGTSPTDNVTNDSTPTFDITAARGAAGTYVRLYRNGTRVGGAYESAGTVTAPPQPDGTWSYAARLVDAAGNESPAGPALDVTIDTTAPEVDEVLVASSYWAPAFTAGLQTAGLGDAGGFALRGASAGAGPLPWASLNRITLRLSEPLVVRAEDLQLHGVSVPRMGFSVFSSDAGGNAHTWTLGSPLSADKLLFQVSETLSDAAGNRLVGAPAGAGGAVAAGVLGTPAAAFQSRLNVLPGDVNRSGSVDGADYLATRARQRATASSTGYSPFHDLDGNARIDVLDLAAARRAQGRTLPSAEPAVAVATTGSGAPGRTNRSLRPAPRTRLAAELLG